MNCVHDEQGAAPADHAAAEGFSLARLRFSVSIQQNGYLPPYKGSAVRGVMGHALRDRFCKNHAAECKQCHRSTECFFVKLFKPNVQQGKSIPAPYVIDPPPVKDTRFNSGARLSCILTLFGRAAEYIPEFIEAVKLGGIKYGLGPERLFYRLDHVESISLLGESVPLWQHGQYVGKNTAIVSFSDLRTRYTKQDDQDVTASVRLLTPLKLKQQGEVRDRLTPELFFETLFRRIKSISSFYQHGSFPVEEYRQKALSVIMQRSSLRWVALERKSANHPGSMNIGGLTGTFDLRQLHLELYPLLKLGELLHLGKNTVYGCGKFSVKLLTEHCSAT